MKYCLQITKGDSVFLGEIVNYYFEDDIKAIKAIKAISKKFNLKATYYDHSIKKSKKNNMDFKLNKLPDSMIFLTNNTFFGTLKRHLDLYENPKNEEIIDAINNLI